MTAKEMLADVTQKREELAKLFADNKDEKGRLTFTVDQLEEVNRRNAELNELNIKWEKARDAEKKAEEIEAENARQIEANRLPVTSYSGQTQKTGIQPETRKGLGELVVESKEYKNRGGAKFEANIEGFELKTLMETGAGFAPEAVRINRVEDYPLRALRVIDLIPTSQTTQSAIKYMRETTHTNNAAEVAEGSLKGEAALAYTEVTDPVQKIAVWIPVTEEQIEDVPGMQGLIQNRLTYMVMNRLDSQLLVGNGTAPNISGITDRSNIQTQAKGADTVMDAIYKAMTKVRGVTAGTGFAEPDAVILHPNDAQDIRLTKTTDGIYIWGSPSEAGPSRIWGVPMVVTPAMTENTGLVGDFRGYSTFYYKKGLTVKTTDSHSDYFTSNKLVVLVELRGALAVFRESAFCTVTSI